MSDARPGYSTGYSVASSGVGYSAGIIARIASASALVILVSPENHTCLTAFDAARSFADNHRPMPLCAPGDEGREPTAGPDRRSRPDRAGPRPVAGEGRDAVPPDRQEPRPGAGVPRDGRPGPDPRVLSPARHRRRGGRRGVPARPPP